jgi:hypothetical protein
VPIGRLPLAEPTKYGPVSPNTLSPFHRSPVWRSVPKHPHVLGSYAIPGGIAADDRSVAL